MFHVEHKKHIKIDECIIVSPLREQGSCKMIPAASHTPPGHDSWNHPHFPE